MKHYPVLYLILLMSMTALASCKIEDGNYDYYTETFELYGEYNGAIGNNGEYNYFICLAEDTFDGEGNAKSGVSYYYFDIFSTQGTPDNNGTVHIPAGTYTLGTQGTTNTGTFTPNYSIFVGNDRYGNHIELGFSSGIIRIACNGPGLYEIEAELTDMAGMIHYVHYIGHATAEDNSQGIIDRYLALEKDLGIQASVANATIHDNMKDIADNSLSNVIFSFTDMDLDSDSYAIPPGSILSIDSYMTLRQDGSIPEGTYSIAADWGKRASTLSPGEEINGQLVGSLVENYDGGTSACLGFIVEGSLQITCPTASQYNISFVFLTDNGHEISGSYSGPMELTETVTSQPGTRLHRPVPKPRSSSYYTVRTR